MSGDAANGKQSIEALAGEGSQIDRSPNGFPKEIVETLERALRGGYLWDLMHSIKGSSIATNIQTRGISKADSFAFPSPRRHRQGVPRGY